LSTSSSGFLNGFLILKFESFRLSLLGLYDLSSLGDFTCLLWIPSSIKRWALIALSGKSSWKIRMSVLLNRPLWSGTFLGTILFATSDGGNIAEISLRQFFSRNWLISSLFYRA
jgi:hypothetical protein